MLGRWAEALLALASGAVGVLTLVRSDWFETVFGVDPDQGSGAIEWLGACALLLTSLVFTVRALRRTRWLQRAAHGRFTAGRRG